MDNIIPKMVKIEMHYAAPKIDDIPEAVRNELKRVHLCQLIKPEEQVAIAVGSRGIANIPLIVKTVVEEVKKAGAHPFIVPAMGSHGGATDEGQKKVLEHLGITPDTVGAPIKSSMEVEEVGVTQNGAKVFFDHHAFQADSIIVINRVKPHTGFTGKNESGLMKMISVGLGKHKGCIEMHAKGLARTIGDAARVAMENTPIKLGIALVENQYDQTAQIVAADAAHLEETDAELLLKAKHLMPALPVEDIDLLIVDEMGKNISGTGMDVHVIGRMYKLGMAEPKSPVIKRIVVRDLTEASHGNALGMGLADLITRRMADKIDIKVTNENVLSAAVLERGRMPIVMETDLDLIVSGLKSIEAIDMAKARVIRIKNTLEIARMEVSEPIAQELAAAENIKILSEPFAWRFDSDGRLL